MVLMKVSVAKELLHYSHLYCVAGFIGDLIWNLDVKDTIYEGMMYIAIAGLGFTASEKFAKKEEK